MPGSPLTVASSRRRRASHHRYTAATADKHLLYERSVQSPEAEIAFVDRVYRKARGRLPDLLREDFCGTAFTSCTWARTRPGNHAIGVDLDAKTLEWAIAHNLAWLNDEERQRVELVRGDVLHVRSDPPADVVLALNFSYFIFKRRADLLAYFKAARRNVRDDGLFVCDAYGGYEAQQVMEETRRQGGFTYVWDQSSYNPVTGETLCRIHFRFPDGTQLRNAFTYDWRLWTLPEIRELLEEAGFARSTVHWEGSDSKGGGNGIFRPTTTGEVCAGWIAYVAAEPT